jgi:hypothetical protein
MRKLDEELNQAQSLKYAVTTQYRSQKSRVENLFKKKIIAKISNYLFLFDKETCAFNIAPIREFMLLPCCFY